MPPRMLPEPTPETRHFWDGCKAGEFRLHDRVRYSRGSEDGWDVVALNP